jgi:hypothetical protein
MVKAYSDIIKLVEIILLTFLLLYYRKKHKNEDVKNRYIKKYGEYNYKIFSTLSKISLWIAPILIIIILYDLLKQITLIK